MNLRMFLRVMVAAAMLAALPLTSSAQPARQNSNLGLKLNVGVGSQRLTSSQNLETGDAAALHLGYGVSQNVTLWLGLQGSAHKHNDNANLESNVGGLELNLQYKLRPYEKFRPYGKVGLGGFVQETEATQTTLTGGGIVWAVGADYRLFRFLSIGGEFFWKDFDYERLRLGENNEFTDLNDPIRGNSNGFMLNIIIH